MFQCYVVDVNGLSVGGFGKSCVFDPTGTAVHQAAGQEEMIAVAIDLDMVRSQREVRMKSLGQLHKSFRDRVVDFPVYDRATFDATYLNSLGPLQIPTRAPAPVSTCRRQVPWRPLQWPLRFTSRLRLRRRLKVSLPPRSVPCQT